MFNFFKKNDPRKEFIDEFNHIISVVNRAPAVGQMVVGNTINILTTILLREFHSLDNFIMQEKHVIEKYISKLTKMEESADDAAVKIGTGIFKMWVGTVLANDRKLYSKFSKELDRLSRLGDLGN